MSDARSNAQTKFHAQGSDGGDEFYARLSQSRHRRGDKVYSVVVQVVCLYKTIALGRSFNTIAHKEHRRHILRNVPERHVSSQALPLNTHTVGRTAYA